MKLKALIVVGLISLSTFVYPQMTINNPNYTPQQLILDVLITGCLQASNVVYTGSTIARGYFHWQGAVNQFPFSGGVILGSGNISQAPGSPGTFVSSTLGTGGNTYLQTLSSTTTLDATMIEFDFIPASTAINFRYIFASEEYPEWVGSSFNDVFGFFLTGPAPTGPAYTNKNIAIVPGTVNTPVSINNVNQNTNSMYYVTQTGNVIVYDGRTVALTATKAVVQCGNYHIRLAISDCGDTAYDSAVFLEAGSFVSGEVVAMDPFNPVGDNHTIYEGCTGYFIFVRTDPTNTSVVIPILLSLSGTAVDGVDYTNFPTSFDIPIGQVSDTVYYTALMDNITEGTEYFIVTLLNGCPCTIGGTNDTVWVYDNVTMNAGITEDDTLICSTSNVQVQLHAYSNTPANITHYHWSTNSFAQNITVTPPLGAITTYYVTVTDDCGQQNVDDITITVSNLSGIALTTANLICYNVCQGSATAQPVNGFPPYTYAWLPAGTGSTTSATASNLCAGNYSVTVSDVYSCQSTAQFTLTQPPSIQLSFTSTPTSCPGASDGSLTVNVTNGVPPFTYSCTNVPLPITSASNTYTFQNMAGGNYTINVTDATNCHASNMFNVGSVQINTSFTATDLMCYGDDNSTATVSISGGTPPYFYQWSTGTSNTNSCSNLSAGNYFCTVLDSHSCIVIIPVVITQPDSVTITCSQDTTMCLTQTATLTAQATGGTPGFVYYWNNTASLPSVDVSPTSSSTYTVYAEDSHGCTSITTDVTVFLFPAVNPFAYVLVDSICAGDETEIFFNVNGGNGGPYNTYLGDSIVTSPVIVAPNVTTNYTLTSYDLCGSPSGSYTVTVYVLNAPGSLVTASQNEGCDPMTVTFTDPLPDEGQTYLWNFGDNSESGFSVSRHPTHTYDQPGVYDVTLTTKSTFGCVSTVVFKNMITVKPSPEAEYVPTPQATSILKPVIYFENLTQGIYNSNWNFGDGSTSALEDVQHTFKDTGIYNVTLIVENLDGCTDTISQMIYINDESAIWVPNAFNPMSDNPENTQFMPAIYGADPNDFHLIIYNRWGSKVFETYNMNHPWNGKLSDGKFALSGTYSWVVIYKDFNGKTQRKSGFVSIIE